MAAIAAVLSDFEVRSTKTGSVRISGGVKRQIMSLLADREMTLTEIAKVTGKAQSTLSVHLDRMVADLLIVPKADASDGRKKVYALSSALVAESCPPNPESDTQAKEMLMEIVSESADMYSCTTDVLLLKLEAYGVSVNPLFFIMGADTASTLVENYDGESVENLLSESSSKLSAMNMGEVTIYSLLPITVILHVSEDMKPVMFSAIGMFMKGFFSKAVSIASGHSYSVTSSETFGAEDNYLRFILEAVN